MTAPDYRGILDNAGADPHAPEGSQANALSQVSAYIDQLRVQLAAAQMTDAQRAEGREASSGR